MQFTQIEYIIVLIVTFMLHHALWRCRNCQKLLLLIVSLYFFAYWDARFIPLLIGYVLIGWLTGIILPKISNEKYSKILLVCSIIFFLILLGIFKYANFFISSLRPLIECIGWKVGTLKWTLPLGISFFTFQSISYVVDVSRKHELRMGILDYALYICFFPKLTAGPLIRCEAFTKQINSNKRINSDDFYEGIRLFIFGLFKKIFIADRLADFIDNVFTNHLVYSGGTLWIAALAYSVYLYCDFSGYSDMAIGSSRLLGIKMDDNFNWPYLSRNITEFWHRWHISLSLWLRDYLYIPLGGNRKGVVRSYVNQIVTMLLGGLWHGANITFLLWGGIHGIMLVAHKVYKTRFQNHQKTSRLLVVFYSLLAFFLVTLAWVLFRADTCKTAFAFLGRMLTFQSGVPWYNPIYITTIAAVVLRHFIRISPFEKYMSCSRGSILSYTVLWVMLWLVILFKPETFAPFVYGSF